MAKNYLKERENILNALMLIKSQDLGKEFFNSSVELQQLQQEIIDFYATNFTMGNKEKAKKILVVNRKIVRTQEVIQISLWTGLLLLAIPINIFLLYVEDNQLSDKY